MAHRSFTEVFDDHLRLSEMGDFENDLRRNFSIDIIVLMENRIYRGHEEVRELARRLLRELPNGKYQNNMILLDKELGMLEWTAKSDKTEVLDGVDSYLFRDGKIIAQTIHYTVTHTSSPRPTSVLDASPADHVTKEHGMDNSSL